MFGLGASGVKLGIDGVLSTAAWFMPSDFSASTSIAQVLGPRQAFLIAVSFGLLATTILYGAMFATKLNNVASYFALAAGAWALKQVLGGRAAESPINQFLGGTIELPEQPAKQTITQAVADKIVNAATEQLSEMLTGTAQTSSSVVQQPVQLDEREPNDKIEALKGAAKQGLTTQAINAVTAHPVLLAGAVVVGAAAYIYKDDIGAAINGAQAAVKNMFTPFTIAESDNFAAEENLSKLAEEVAEVERSIIRIQELYKKYEDTPDEEVGWFFSTNPKDEARKALLDYARVWEFIPELFEKAFFTGEEEPSEKQQKEIDKNFLVEIEEKVAKLSPKDIKDKANEVVEERIVRRINKLADAIEEKHPALNELMEFVGQNREQYGLFINFINACKTTASKDIGLDIVEQKLTNKEEVKKIAAEVVKELEGREPIDKTPDTQFGI